MNQRADIWVIEDDRSLLWMYQELLQDYTMQQYTSLAELQEALAQTSPENLPYLFIVDCKLEDGYIFSWLKQQSPEFLLSHKVIVVTAIQEAEVVYACKGSYLVDIVQKPFASGLFRDKVDRMLGSVKSLQVTLNDYAHTLSSDATVTLPQKEFAVVRALYHAPGNTMKKSALLNLIWQDNPGSRSLDVTINKLKARLKPFDLAISYTKASGEYRLERTEQKFTKALASVP